MSAVGGAGVRTAAQAGHRRDARSPEAELIVACVGNPATSDSIARARNLASRGPDWHEVIGIAERHGVSSLVYRFLGEHAADCVPAATLAHLRSAYMANLARSTMLARELVRISAELSAAGVAMLALKGPTLAVLAYGDLASRHFADLDVLIREDDLPRTSAILARSGYRPRRCGRDTPGVGFFRSTEDEFWREGGAVIDVHWRLVPGYFPFAIDPDLLWQRALMVELEGAAVATLAPADLLNFLIAHATKHGWPNLREICDVAALAGRTQFDWDALLHDSERGGCARMMKLGALLAAEPGGAAIAPAILACARSDARASMLAHEIRARLFTEGGSRPGLFHDWIVPLRAIEGGARRARYLLERALRPTIEDWETLALPRALYPLYYAARPLRLALQHGPRLFSRTPARDGLA